MKTVGFLSLLFMSMSGFTRPSQGLVPSDFTKQLYFYAENFTESAKPEQLKLMCYLKSGSGRDYLPCGDLVWTGRKWQIQLRVGVYGVTSTRGVTDEKIEQIRAWQTQLGQARLLKKEHIHQGQGAPSWAGVPEVAQMIQSQLKSIAQILSHARVETQIKMFFVNEKELLTQKEWNSQHSVSPLVDQKLREPEVQKKLSGDDFLPLQYVATPERDYIRPGSGDPFADPEFMAHEIFHFISLDQKNDGFLYGNYPLNGVMNSYIQFQALRKHKTKPQIQAIEFNTLYLNQKIYREAATKARTGVEFVQLLRKLADTYATAPEHVPNYYSEGGQGFPPQDKDRILLPHYKIQNSYPTKSKEAKMSEEQFLTYWVTLQEHTFFGR